MTPTNKRFAKFIAWPVFALIVLSAIGNRGNGANSSGDSQPSALKPAVVVTAEKAAPEEYIDPHAYTIQLMIVYDAGCEKLPPLVAYGMALEHKDIPEATLLPATKKIQAAIKREGAEAFCARLKPRVDKTLARMGH
jgi:hypothetical protein